MSYLGLRKCDDRNHGLSTEEDYLVRLEKDHVCALWTPLNWLVSSALKSDDVLIWLAILSPRLVKFVDDYVLAISVEVLFPLDIEDWSAQVAQVSCSLWQLELFISLHDAVKVGQEASSEDVILGQLEAVEESSADACILLVVHADICDSKSLVSLWVDGYINVLFLNTKVVLSS